MTNKYKLKTDSFSLFLWMDIPNLKSIGPNALKTNLNDLKKLNTSSMTNGSSEQIHINKHESDKYEHNAHPTNNTSNLAIKTTADDIQIKIETPAQNFQINQNSIFSLNEKKNNEELSHKNGTENTEKLKPKKSKQVIFNSEKDKVILVENWKRFNGVNQKICKCTLI